MSDRIEHTITLHAPIETVWHALTDHQEFGAWFRVDLEAPFVVGQEVRGRITHPGYEHVIWRAIIARMDAPRVFAMTWRPYAIDPDADYSHEEPTLVEFTLEPVAEGARLVLVESSFDKIPAARRAEAFRMNDGGWTAQMRNIRAHVEV